MAAPKMQLPESLISEPFHIGLGIKNMYRLTAPVHLFHGGYRYISSNTLAYLLPFLFAASGANSRCTGHVLVLRSQFLGLCLSSSLSYGVFILFALILRFESYFLLFLEIFSKKQRFYSFPTVSLQVHPVY